MKTKINNKTFSTRQNSGFTLIETVIAILILSLSIGALLTLSAGGFFSIRYARNQIVAYNLMQESLEYIRNSRDSAILQAQPWSTWKNTLSVDGNGNQSGTNNGCFASGGCTVDPYVNTGFSIKACSTNCQTVYFYPANPSDSSSKSFYGYLGASYANISGITPVATTYVKKVTATTDPSGNVLVTSTVSWRNGSSTKTISQPMLLTGWTQ